MCGIAGFCGFADPALLQRMGDAQAHRGPDGEGFYSDGERCSLSHRILAIIDRAHGQQPFRSADGRLAMTYNGEVYNYRELRTELEGLGRSFVTQSDTEVVLQSFEEWGDKAFDRFNGDFAIGIWDEAAQRLTLARDHVGVKPLYWTTTPRGLLFASEIKALLEADDVTAAADEKTLYRYLRFRIHDDSTATFFAGINKLSPGQMLVVEADGTHSLSMFSSLKDELRELAAHQKHYSSPAEFKAGLTQAIRLRLNAEVPVGTCLSGGLDSSTVVATVSMLMAQDKGSTEAVGASQQTFSAVFPNSVNDEEKYVDAVLDRVRGTVTPHRILPTSEGFLEDLEDFVRSQEEPTISTGPYAQYVVMREASQHVTVLLDGQGADEMMAGYLPYYWVRLKQLRAQGNWFVLVRELFTSLDVLTKFAKVKMRTKLRRTTPVVVSTLLTNSFKAAHSGETFTVTGTDLTERLLEDVFHNSLPSLLRYEDKNTMRFSLEGRVPFLDRNLLAIVFGLEPTAIIRDGWNKRVLRDAVTDLLPELIHRRRNKIGFTTPEQEWFLRLKNRIYGIFLSESFANRPYWDANAVTAAFEEFVQGKNDDTMTFWRLMNTELWLRAYVDPKVVPEKKASAPKELLAPNHAKNLEIDVDGAAWARHPLRTGLVDRETVLTDYVVDHVAGAVEAVLSDGGDLSTPWYLVLSEKVVAISQGRSYFLWEITPSRTATWLSRRVTRTPHGIGLGSPWTMHLAIGEVGLPRILAASAIGAAGKVTGRKGDFYRVAGPAVRAIDGPTEYSVYPSNVSAKLAPARPAEVAKELGDAIRAAVPAAAAATFGGVCVIDANDLGRNVLGQATDRPDSFFEAVFADNPLGQSSEQTPMALVRRV